MRTVRTIAWLLGTTLSGYLVAWTFGLFVLGPLLTFFFLTGRMRVVGYGNLIRAALRGRLLILMNHPTLLFETFGIGALLLPLFLFVPWCFIWSTPDKRLLDQWKLPRWVRTMLRCLPIDRSDTMTGVRSTFAMKRVLQWRGVVVAHPERGRTFGEANRRREPIVRSGRAMQKIASSLTEVAHLADARILPGWVEVPFSKEPVSILTSLRRMFGRKNRRYWPVTYSFSRVPYRTGTEFNRETENARLQNEIFEA
ncbi:hypothetical protein K8R03_03265 [Candidatus Kaiserbacteria bacterium]|nr:hypothetical protein [Candidatus Kaiserbacteria bacterium]